MSTNTRTDRSTCKYKADFQRSNGKLQPHGRNQIRPTRTPSKSMRLYEKAIVNDVTRTMNGTSITMTTTTSSTAKYTTTTSQSYATISTSMILVSIYSNDTYTK
tara:strand:- start:1321 stop:1632 length:312 start_codon:yes stop_codon:yes gene_type:complete